MYRWNIIKAFENGREIEMGLTTDFNPENSQEAIALRHKSTGGTAEFIVVDDYEFIQFHSWSSWNGTSWMVGNMVFVYRRVR